MSLALELVVALKRLLKAQGLTYAQLAQRLDLSEAAVKRMFSRGSMTVQRLESICEVLGVGLADLAEHARPASAPLTELSAEQEEELLREPPLLLALYLSLNGWSQEEVLAAYTFTPVEWTRLLARLDRMRVLDLQPGNRVKLRTARNFRWRPGGPIQRFFEKRLLPEFFARGGFQGEQAALHLLAGMLSEDSVRLLRKRLDEFAAEFDLLLSRDVALPVAGRRGVSFVLAMRPWALPMFDALRRSPAA
jgi:transcriptional regulator with XRE-family HTH domain